MSSRAIFSLLFALVGATAASADPLVPGLKAARFQPGNATTLPLLRSAKVPVFRPASRLVQPTVSSVKPVVSSPRQSGVVKPRASARSS